MKGKFFVLLCTVLLTMTAATQNAKRFEGYSFVVDADSTGACPVRFLPTRAGKTACRYFWRAQISRRRRPA